MTEEKLKELENKIDQLEKQVKYAEIRRDEYIGLSGYDRVFELERENRELEKQIESHRDSLRKIADHETAIVVSNGVSSKYLSYEQGWECVASFAKRELSKTWERGK